ncbi:TPA: hypothetical protein O6805_000930 [Staphylococcus aureus]|nr:hypothetical protein [Staphylococcus aureus]
MSGLFNFFVLGADRPSLGGVGDWISNEVGTDIGLVVLVVGGFLSLVSKGPEQVFNAIAGVWKMIFGG